MPSFWSSRFCEPIEPCGNNRSDGDLGHHKQDKEPRAVVRYLEKEPPLKHVGANTLNSPTDRVVRPSRTFYLLRSLFHSPRGFSWFPLLLPGPKESDFVGWQASWAPAWACSFAPATSAWRVPLRADGLRSVRTAAQLASRRLRAAARPRPLAPCRPPPASS